MTHIDPREAASALSEIDSIAVRVRRSRFYRLSSLLLIVWGVVVAAGYVASFVAPRRSLLIWGIAYVAGIAGSVAASLYQRRGTGINAFDGRAVAALLLYAAFGLLCTTWLGTFDYRAIAAFWPIYFMLGYTIVGLWAGYALIVIGLSVTALTLVGYVYAGPYFNLWMAAVNGGGLVLGGLWMRRS